jgi:hypothetical protein
MKTLAWAFGLAMLFAPAAMAQTHDELVTRIKAATSSVDGTMIKDKYGNVEGLANDRP